MKQNSLLPPIDIVTNALGGDSQAIQELLIFYRPYIHSAASIPVLAKDGRREGVYVSDDLEQDMMIRVVHAIKVLSTKF